MLPVNRDIHADAARSSLAPKILPPQNLAGLDLLMVLWKIVQNHCRLLRSRRNLKSTGFLMALISVTCTLYLLYNHTYHGTYAVSPIYSASSVATSSGETLGGADKLYVLSLKTRPARREDMEKLRAKLKLNWSYFDAFEANDPLVAKIMHRVRFLRASLSLFSGNPILDTTFTPAQNQNESFKWPRDIDKIVHSEEVIDLWSGDNWPLHASSVSIDPKFYPPVVCATQDYNITGYTPDLSEYRLLTDARIACWHSHLSVIHSIANAFSPSGISMILEDDVDMASDIQSQLENLWTALPADWDIVFLGHCWSNESYYPPLPHRVSPSAALGGNSSQDSPGSRLHPSRAPKCTHAYALSHTGARRLLLHLLYPPFAYSRAIDQAISWLIESGRLKGFSVVPSLVIQRKIANSDVIVGQGTGSKWKDSLSNGVLGGPSI